MGFWMTFWKNGWFGWMSWNPAKLPEMNILNGKSTGLIPVMIVVNLRLKSNGDLQMQNLVKLKFIMFFLFFSQSKYFSNIRIRNPFKINISVINLFMCCINPSNTLILHTQRNSIDVYTSAGYILRIDYWEAEKNLKTIPSSCRFYFLHTCH